MAKSREIGASRAIGVLSAVLPRAEALAPVLTRMSAVALAAGIFVADTVTDLEIAVAVFYIVVVLLSVSFLQRRGVLIVSAVCIGLTVLSHIVTPSGDYEAGLINGAISLTAIAATTYLALRIEAARAAVNEARSQLVHLARVSSLGELAASIAHEVNQPLAGIAAHGSACTRWLSVSPPNVPEAKRSASLIVDDAKRASAIIDRVRSLARKAPPQFELVAINDVVEDVLLLTKGELHRHRASVRTLLSDDLPLVHADRVQLQQVMLNLVLNAIDAVAGTDGIRELIVRTDYDGASGMVAVAFHDSGAGFGAVDAEAAFDAFYSTKTDGMGMGLTISRSIIEAHGGRISVTPSSAHGATVQFTLPVDQEIAP